LDEVPKSLIGLLTALALSADWQRATLLAPEELLKIIKTRQEVAGQEERILRSIDKHGNIGIKLEPSALSYILRQAQENITRPGNKKPRQ
jgi:DNA-binding TFAR19-related protein (PDSD5 family)